MNFRELKKLCNGDRAAQHRFNDLRETVSGRDPSPEEVDFVLGNTQLTGGNSAQRAQRSRTSQPNAVHSLLTTLQRLKQKVSTYKKSNDRAIEEQNRLIAEKTAALQSRNSTTTQKITDLQRRLETEKTKHETKITNLAAAITEATELVEQIAGEIP